VNTVEGYAGDFSLATRIEGHRVETLVHVNVSQPDTSRLVLDFGNDEVLRDACCLLCGSIGTRVLLELGYTGPLITRPPLAAGASSQASRRR
jgi:hypothetical protein